MAISTCTVTGNVRNLLGNGVTDCQIQLSVLTPFYHSGSFVSGAIATVTTNSNGDFSVTCIETQSVGKKIAFTFNYFDGVANRKQKQYQVVVPTQSSALLSDLIAANATIGTITNTFPAVNVTVNPISGLVSTQAQAALAEIQGEITAETTARSAADTTLQANINAEATTRANADSTLTTAVAGKEPAITAGTTAQYFRGDKSFQDFNTAARAAISGSAPIAVSAGGVVSIPTATDSVTGAMSAADHTQLTTNTANIASNTSAIATKEPAITAGTTAQYYRGDKTFQNFNTAAQAAISGTAPISVTSGVVAIATATDSVTGAMSAADHTQLTANTAAIATKEPAITAGTSAQYYRGDKTMQTLNTAAVAESTNLYYTDVRVSANTSVAANTTHRTSSSGVHGITGSVVGTSDSQIITNKDIDGGTASNTSRITLPKALKATLDGLTRKAGTILFGTDTTAAYIDNGSTLLAIGTASLIAPTVQKFLSSSGTYTKPAGVLYIKVRMVGGGGGGGGAGAGAGAGGPGGATTFGPSLLSAGGGAGGGTVGGTGGAGGTSSLGTGPLGIALPGGTGGGALNGNTQNYNIGGMGASSPFGGAGGNGVSNVAGFAAGVNTGSGGGGGSMGPAVSSGGSGGGSGGYVDAIITSPSATYAYVVGAGGTAGTNGTSGGAGGAGGSGVIIVEEFYQ